MKLDVVGSRALDLEHTLFAIRAQEHARPSKHDTVAVHCTCGERLTITSAGDEHGALILAERNHRNAIGWPEIEHWHGTPNGYVNRGCRCDPCRWAWASYRRGDDPVFPGPVWFDDWLTSGAVAWR